MKLIISTIASAVVMYILSFLFYSIFITSEVFKSYVVLYRSHDSMIYWAIIVGTLLSGFFLSLIYMNYAKRESPFKEGIVYGLLIGLFYSLPYVFFVWASFPIKYPAAILDGIGMGIRIFLACIVIALIFGKKKPA